VNDYKSDFIDVNVGGILFCEKTIVEITDEFFEFIKISRGIA
jgi:altronate dehydratase